MQILFPSFNLNVSVFYFEYSMQYLSNLCGPLVINQNTMPSPAQIMFMSSLINNVPELSPKHYYLYAILNTHSDIYFKN